MTRARAREYPKSDAPIREFKVLVESSRGKSKLRSKGRYRPVRWIRALVRGGSRGTDRYNEPVSLLALRYSRCIRSRFHGCDAREGGEVCEARQSETEGKRNGGGSIISRAGMREAFRSGRSACLSEPFSDWRVSERSRNRLMIETRSTRR